MFRGEEPYPELQIMVAVLSCGPVGPSDKIGYEDRANIFKSITNDGLILKPDRPAFAIDKQILQQTGLIDDGPKGQVEPLSVSSWYGYCSEPLWGGYILKGFLIALKQSL